LPAARLHETGILLPPAGEGAGGDREPSDTVGGRGDPLQTEAGGRKETASSALGLHAADGGRAGAGQILRSFEGAPLAGAEEAFRKAPDDVFGPLDETLSEPCEGVHTDRPEPALGERHHLHTNRRGVWISESRHRRLFEKDRRLLLKPGPDGTWLHSGVADGNKKQSRKGASGASFGSGFAILQRGAT